MQSFDVCTGIATAIGAVDPPVACTGAADCADGSFRNPVTGHCTVNAPGTCRSGDDCPSDTTWESQSVTVGAPVSDLDDDGDRPGGPRATRGEGQGHPDIVHRARVEVGGVRSRRLAASPIDGVCRARVPATRGRSRHPGCRSGSGGGALLDAPAIR